MRILCSYDYIGLSTITTEIKAMVKSVLPNRADNDFIGLEEVGPTILEKTQHKLNIDKYVENQQPLLGERVTNGSKPLFGLHHKGTDAIFALACNYPILYYKRFVGSLRKAGYSDDIVLAVSPPQGQAARSPTARSTSSESSRSRATWRRGGRLVQRW